LLRQQTTQGVDVIGDKGDHPGPIELAANVLDCLGDARVTSEAVVMAGAKDILIGWPGGQAHKVVPCSKENCHLVRVTMGRAVEL